MPARSAYSGNTVVGCLTLFAGAFTWFWQYMIRANANNNAYEQGGIDAITVALMFGLFVVACLCGEYVRAGTRVRRFPAPLLTAALIGTTVGYLQPAYLWAPGLFVIPCTMVLLWWFGVDYRIKARSGTS